MKTGIITFVLLLAVSLTVLMAWRVLNTQANPNLPASPADSSLTPPPIPVVTLNPELQREPKPELKPQPEVFLMVRDFQEQPEGRYSLGAARTYHVVSFEATEDEISRLIDVDGDITTFTGLGSFEYGDNKITQGLQTGKKAGASYLITRLGSNNATRPHQLFVAYNAAISSDAAATAWAVESVATSFAITNY